MSSVINWYVDKLDDLDAMTLKSRGTRYYGEVPFNRLYDKPELTAYDYMLERKKEMYPNGK